jgi:hypothetical protein
MPMMVPRGRGSSTGMIAVMWTSQKTRPQIAPEPTRLVPFTNSIFENESVQCSYVYELVRYALEPQPRGAWHPHAPRAHGDVRPDDDDGLLRGDEQRHCDDALAGDASATVPFLGSSVF